jgi:PilZ domain
MQQRHSSSDGMIAARQDPPFSERRQAPRYLLRDVRGTMTWQDASGDVSCEVNVLNISGGGAAVHAENAPPVGQTLRLLLRSESIGMEAVEAQVLATSLDASGKQLVRLRFAQWMPLDALLEKHQERRMWQRYPARERPGTLTWMDASNETTIHGDLLNISGGGAAFASTDQPPPGVPIWFQLDASARQVDPNDPVECRLVAVSDDPSGQRITHLQFVASCPMLLFELAVHGSR